MRDWVRANVPAAWREAGSAAGPRRYARSGPRRDYEDWYPTFGRSGLVVPTWPVAYGGLDVSPAVARAIEAELRPYNLGRLNPLGLNLAAPALFAHGTEEQRLRFLPPIVRNEEVWCQLFSEPGAGSDLASLATRAERDGDDWVLTGQKVWTTWAHLADFGVLPRPDRPRRAQAPRHHLLPRRPARSPASRSGRCGTSAARSTSTRCSSTASACPTPTGSGRSATAGGSPTPPCRASARWWRARGRGASTASAAAAPGAWWRRRPSAGPTATRSIPRCASGSSPPTARSGSGPGPTSGCGPG